jgi:hypothetical protein
MDSQQVKVGGQSHWLFPAFIISAVVIFGAVGSIAYFRVWQHGDEKAQAFSGLLAFVAAIVSSIVTIFYVYLTNASLRKAQASIDLQQGQLDQMRSSVELQRKEWEQKVRVFPQFWITSEGERNWHVRNPSRPSLDGALHFRKGFVVYVWNYSEQSFLIDSIRIQRADVVMRESQRTVDEQVVVKPHSVEKLDVSTEIMQLLTQTLDGNKPKSAVTGLISGKAVIFVRLTYNDWSQKHNETEIREFKSEYREGGAAISIKQSLELSAFSPSV